MKIDVLLVLLIVCSFTVNAQNRAYFRPPAKAAKAVSAKPDSTNSQTLPIRRVILYSNGVAYIERRGVVSGKAEINLSFKQSQVDDVLKSMVVLDLGEGRIGAVSYNSSAPPSARLNEIPFAMEAETADPEAEQTGGLEGVLKQLQGAKVIVAGSKKTATGSILNVRKKQIVKTSGAGDEAEKTALQPEYSLVIASDAGEIASFNLSDIVSVKLLDEGAQKDIREFASAAASARRRDAKTITVTSEGEALRELVVSYTIAAPVWKTTYRVVLDNAGKPFFQGWAIVENVSEESWENVQLSLVSGSPISFIQPLQNPLYRHRPVMEIPENLSLEPQRYEQGIQYVQGNISARAVGAGSGSGDGDGYGNGRGYGSGAPIIKPAVSTEISDALMNQEAGIKTAATGEKLGDLFEYRVEQAVSVPRDRSALIPIVQAKMDGERVSIYREPDEDDSAAKDRPTSGLLLKNTTPLTFETGALTVLERNAYAGEALMERLKAGENRLISFALDLETLVTVKTEAAREPAKLVKAVDGNFQIHYFRTSRKIYALQNQSDRARTVFVEHPITENWVLSSDTTPPFETTKKYYRFKIELKPFETQVLPVTERQGLMDSYVLRDLKQTDVELFVRQNYVTDVTRQKLEKLINMRAEINRINEQLKNIETEVKLIAEDQARLRENIESLAKTAEAKSLVARYIAKAGEQETQLEQFNRDRKNLNAERERLEKELAAEIRAFTI